MRLSGFFFPALIVGAVFVCASQPIPAVAKAPPRTQECAVPAAGTQIVEPPDVIVSKLPLNATHEHELVMSVHQDGVMFCYHYTMNGVAYRVPPTIRVHRGERLALRLVNAMHGKTGAENLSSNAIAACMPMAMPNARKSVATGYLNHPVSDINAKMMLYDTNIHFHGFQGPAQQENIFLSTLSNPMHACEYRLDIPRTQPPGTYFYHPHAHGTSGDQVYGGLSGVWIVEPDMPAIDRADDHTLIVRYLLPERDDMFSEPDGRSIQAAAAARRMALKGMPVQQYDPFNPPPWPSAIALANGGRGLDPNPCVGIFPSPFVSIDGSPETATLHVQAGHQQLLRIVNATSDSIKYFRLRDAAGHLQSMHVVARDGVPVGGSDAQPLSQYAGMSGILLPPAGRADVLVSVQPGNDLTLYSDHVCLGPIQEVTLKHALVTMRAVPPEGPAQAAIATAAVGRSQTPAAKLLAYARAHPSLVRRRAITYTEYVFPNRRPAKGAHPEFFITDTTNRNFAETPFWPQYGMNGMTPRHADIVVKQGTIEEWTLLNATAETHSFHIHQMAFVAEDDAAGPTMLDTLVVPFGTQLPNKAEPDYPLIKPSATRILLDFRHVPRGTFVFHCHMLFHEDRGMMGVVKVI
jgi:FtsP/CotA-like multicopper oxidase with cupredoxin domain